MADKIDIPGYDEEKLRAEIARNLAASKSHLADWKKEVRDLYDLTAGRQWSPADQASMDEQERPTVTFNLSGKFLDVVQGLQINNRQDIRYFPREEGDAKKNELLTGAAEWSRDQCDAADEETDAFHDCVLGGLGWVEWYLNKDGDPPLPAGERRDPLEMYYDPRARKKGLSDARWMCRVKPMDPAEYEERFGEDAPSAEEQIKLETDETEGEIQLIPANHDYGSDGTPGAAQFTGKGSIPVADYQFYREEKFWNVTADIGEGPTTRELKTAEWKSIEPALQTNGAPYKAEEVKRRVYYRVIVTPTGIKQAGKSPYQRGFTYHAITGKRDRNKNTWYGIGRAILDPQKFTNKFFSSILFQIMTNSKGGLVAEATAFENRREAEANWSKPNAFTIVADGALTQGRVQPKPPPPYPEGMDRLMAFAVDALPGVSGLNPEIMGMTGRVQPGIVEAQRKQSAMAIIAWAFDAMRRYYRSAGRQIAQYIVDYVPEGTLVRVVGESGAKYVPLVKESGGLPFDVIVDEAPTSTNMKERVWMVLETIMPQLLTAGLPIPKEVLDYSPLPADLAQKWKGLLETDPQKQQAEAQKAEQQFMAALKKVLAEAAQKEADARLKDAQTAKTTAETTTEQVNTLSAAANAGAAQAGMH